MKHLTRALRRLSGALPALALLLLAMPTRAQISAPGSIAVNEDSRITFRIEIAAWGPNLLGYDGFAVASGSPTLIESVTAVGAGTKYIAPSIRAYYDITVVPRPNMSGTGSITLVATGSQLNLRDVKTVTVNVNPVNDPPYFANPFPSTGQTTEDTLFTTDIYVGDIDNPGAMQVSATSSNPALVPNSPSNLSFTLVSSTGDGSRRYRLNVTPALNATGQTTVTVLLTDGQLTVTRNFILTVLPANDPPTATLPSLVEVPEDGTQTFNATIVDPDTAATEVSFRVLSSSDPDLIPIGNVSVTGSGTTRTVSLRPQSNRNGGVRLTFETFETANPDTTRTTSSLAVAVAPVNDAPVAGPIVALDLPGGDAALTAPDAGLASPNSPHTVELWVRPSAVTTRQWLLNLGKTGSGSHHWLLTTSPNEGRVTLSAGAWDGPQVRAELPIETWTHVASVYDGNTFELYLNGISVGTIPLNAFELYNEPSRPYLWLGQRPLANEANFRGQIDEFRLWDRALSSKELASHFRAPRIGDPTVDPADTGLLVYWRLDEADGNVAFDSARADGSTPGALVRGAGWTAPIRRDYYSPIVPVVISSSLSSLYESPLYPDNPTAVFAVPGAFAAPTNVANYYGQRLSGYLVAPITGAYTFSIASDDQSELFLSPDDDPTHKVRIARVNAATGDRVWDAEPGQRSDPVNLVEGQRYYLEANMVEVGGGDHLSVRWDLPDGTVEAPIPAYRLDSAPHFGTRSVAEDEPTALYLTATDFETLRGEASTTLDFVVVRPPRHGTLNPPTGGRWTTTSQNPITYTPSLDYNGPDDFVYKLVDQDGAESAPARVSLVVYGANDLPVISPIADLTILESESSGPLPFSITDADGPAEAVTITASTSDPSLVPLSGITVVGTGANRTVSVTPAPGELGTATITLTAFDGDLDARTKSEVFKVRVDPRPAYALIDLGDLGQRNQSFGRGVNDTGWAAASAQSQPGDPKAALFRGLGSSGLLEDLTPSGYSRSRASAINSLNTLVGSATPDNTTKSEAFIWRNNLLTSLRLDLAPGEDSVATAINDNDDVAGSLRIGSDRLAFLMLGVGTRTNLPGFGGSNASAEALNNRSTLAGWATDGSGKPHPLSFSLAAGQAQIPELQGHDAGHAYGINDDDLVVGDSYDSADPQATVRAFLREGSTISDLGTLPGGTNAIAYAINNFRQIVGEANDASGQRRAFLRSAERNFDLNDLVGDSRTLAFSKGQWTLEEARSISRNGTIAGTGRYAGRSRAFLAVPAWVIGRQIARPEGTVARRPEIELIDGSTDDNPENAFIWSQYENKLYAVRPVTARIKWFKSFRDLLGSGTNITVNTERVEVVGITVWPKDPQIHIATAPVEIEPSANPSFGYGFQNILFFTGSVPTVDPTTKTYNKTAPGYSVLYYLATGPIQPRTPNPITQRPYLEVVRTFEHSDLLVRSNAVIGTTLTEATHQDYGARNGFILNEIAPYDGAGPERAYDRATRTGPILPVNLDTPSPSDDLIVVWYHFNRVGVAWPVRPVHYAIQWPSDDTVSRIVIASTLGSGGLFDAQFPERRVYNQPDRALPGFNPNEEHAFLSPANGSPGEALFALRNDLNDKVAPKASEPYALLKYRDPSTTAWSIKPFKVVAEQPSIVGGQGPFLFQFSGIAGNEIPPPYPLSRFALCPESYGASGPYWEDYSGRLYARAAGAGGNQTNVVVRWFYPLQPGFFYDFNGDKTNDVPNGTSLAWLDGRPAGALTPPNAGTGVSGTPVAVTYAIRWPTAPTLQIGETLMTSKRGLPAVKNMAKVESIYDDLQPGWNPLADEATPINTLARLYDPLSTRRLRIPDGWLMPASIARVNRSGKEVFTGLPYILRARLLYDPINRTLEFSGILDEASYAGEPLLLPNVLSSRERDVLKGLAPGDPEWSSVMDRLYDRTRNPNQVDLDPLDGKPDQGLRIGLASQYVYQWTERVTDPQTGQSRDIVHKVRTFQTPAELSALNLNGYRMLGTNVVPEPLGDLPKALTAGLAGVPSPATQGGSALRFSGQTDNALDLGTTTPLDARPFTIEFWARRETAGQRRVLLSQGNALPRGTLAIGWTPEGGLFVEFEPGSPLASQAFPADLNAWAHWAVTYDPVENSRQIFHNGQRVAADNPGGGAFLGTGSLLLGRKASGELPAENFVGSIDDLRLWSAARTAFAIRQDFAKRLTGDEEFLTRYFRFDEATPGVAQDWHPGGAPAPFEAGVTRVASDAPTGMAPRYLTLVENNDPALGALPVSLHIIRVDDGPFAGDLKPILPDDVFDQRLTIRHSSDFGGDPDRVVFEWYIKPDEAGFDPEDLPLVNADGSIADLRGWMLYASVTPPDGRGVNDVTLGMGAESGLTVISDNWFVARYRGFNVGLRGDTVWSDWIGDPSGTTRPRAALAEGWVKRVIRGLNPFDARVKDFHAAAINTFSSMLVQAGPRYEGDIAFNPSADNLNSIGLIEAYQTVLNRARRLSIDGTPAVNFNSANNALLLASSRISDLYMLLGNEAYADAQDPTIGFGTTSLEYGSSASSIFAFQNQLTSLLDEELVLLRGRDDTFAGVGARPVYNRLFWNFTLGEGEVAYQQTYNVNDQNFDGFIDEKDARILYPQGHGDAWGHYLTAIKAYYALLRHPQFTWIPRTERVNVAGVAQEVDFLDERKFAKAAAARARVGRETVDLTYRLEYVEDPAGQWQGYEDPRADRAWGVTDWARRAGQGAYLDWLTANAILQSVDRDPTHVGIRKIDRQTVEELTEISDQAREVQATLDKADLGLNPVGLAKGVVTFDLDPTFNEVGSTAQIGRRAVQGLTHFDQIMERAVKGLENGLRVFNEANRSTQNLRQNQDTIDDLTRNARNQEIDFQNRLIEIFGYPYAGDIGAGKIYPSGYNGADLYHYMYIDGGDITGARYKPAGQFSGYFNPTKGGDKPTFFIGHRKYTQDSILDPNSLDSSILKVDYPTSAADYSFTATSEMGKRRAPGELQQTLSDLVQANADYKIALQNYEGLILQIQDQLELLETLENVNAVKTAFKSTQLAGVIAANTAVGIMRGIELNLRTAGQFAREFSDAMAEAPPKVVGVDNDATSLARSGLKANGALLGAAVDVVANTLQLAEEVVGLVKEAAGLGVDLALQVADQTYEVAQSAKAIEALLRNEAALRLEVYKQAEAIRQIAGRYQASLAEGTRILDDLVRFRAETAADVTEARYQDMTFRIFRNDALQKYRAQFDLAARYTYLTATAYDYEINLLGDDPRGGADFLAQIVRQRSLGQVQDGEPVVGEPGLADLLGRMIQNFDAVRGQFGFNNPQIEANRFSLRQELFRIQDEDPNNPNDPSDERWRAALRDGHSANGATAALVPDLWALPEFRRHCRPFAPEALGPQPGLVLRFPSTIQFGLNFFNMPLGAGDSAYDPSRFSTKIRSTGVWFSNYDGNGLSFTPRIYIVPIGSDVLRSPTQNDDFLTREWRVIDQVIPVPFPIGTSSLSDPLWIPEFDTLGGSFASIRRHGGIRAYHDSGGEFDFLADQDQIVSDARLVGRSVWNTEWMIIIPGGTLLADPNQGLEKFIDSNTDIKVLFRTYSYSGL